MIIPLHNSKRYYSVYFAAFNAFILFSSCLNMAADDGLQCFALFGGEQKQVDAQGGLVGVAVHQQAGQPENGRRLDFNAADVAPCEKLPAACHHDAVWDAGYLAALPHNREHHGKRHEVGNKGFSIRFDAAHAQQR